MSLALVFLALLASLIVPEEFATLLGLVFSTIPQVKKGTDSRIGFGYRFGNHADAQVVFEIGPQKNTQKLGPDSSSDSGDTFKRDVRYQDYGKVGCGNLQRVSSCGGFYVFWLAIGCIIIASTGSVQFVSNLDICAEETATGMATDARKVVES